MKKEEDSVRLAEVMVETGKRMGKKVVALITDMDQPLGRMAGHSNEVIECIDVSRVAARRTSANSASNFPRGCFIWVKKQRASTKAENLRRA